MVHVQHGEHGVTSDSVCFVSMPFVSSLERPFLRFGYTGGMKFCLVLLVTSQIVLLTSRNYDGSRSWMSPGLYFVDCVVSSNPFMCYNHICRIRAREAAACNPRAHLCRVTSLYFSSQTPCQVCLADTLITINVRREDGVTAAYAHLGLSFFADLL